MKKNRTRIIVGVLICIAVGGLAAVNIIKGQGKGMLDFGAVIEVEARKVEKGTLSSVVTASGLAELGNKKETYLDSGTKVNQVLVKQYAKVRKGEQILILDLDDLYMQLDKELVNLEIQEYTLQKTAGLKVDSSLGDMESARMIAANDVNTAQNTLTDANNDLVRQQSLYESGANSLSDLEDAKKRVADAEIALHNAQIRLANAVNNETTGDSIGQANVDACSLRIQDLERRIARASEAQYASIDGIVVGVNVKDGQTASGAEPAMVIGDFSSLRIRANVNEADKNMIKTGQAVNITSDAIKGDAQIAGRVESVALVASNRETSTGQEKVFETLISIERALDYMGILSPGQNVDCSIKAATAVDALICSFDMIVDDKDGRKYVFVVDGNTNKVKKQYIVLGLISDLDAEVKEGLQAGDLVVLNPPLNLKDGSRIKISSPESK